MAQPGLQTIAIHILPNITQSKANQTVKCGQLIEYVENEARRLVPDHLLFFEKV